MKIGIIGAGLGGLLAGSALLREGNDVELFEKLPQPGGRFTNLEYKGYQLSTGALHMIPHGNNGPLSDMLKSLNADIEIVTSEPMGLLRVDGKDYTNIQVKDLFPMKEKLRLIALLALLRMSSGNKESFEEWMNGKINHPLAYQIADSFGIWMLSLRANQVSSKEFIALGKSVDKFGGPGIPIGGCKGVTDALVEVIEAEGGTINYKSKVAGITEDGGEMGV
ncbi:MAG: NAD(P)-binding protein [Desulfatiglandales bacterium]